MTNEEAIMILDPETRLETMRKIPVFERIDADQEACRLAVAALRAQAEADKNDPLTLDELREMNGEPVWVCDPTDVKLGSWSLIDLEYDMCVATAGGLTLFEKYGKTWIAYRRKPEEEMREILFRGKAKNGKWVYGDYMRYAGGAQIRTHDADGGTRNCIVDPETVGQYTGLTDKNGVKIFQGDLVLLGDSKTLVHVEFADAFSWVCTCKAFGPYYRHRLEPNPEYYEVIGNVHDNPDLLEGDSKEE